MGKNILDIIKNSGCIEGGTFEAYIKAREVLLNSYIDGDKLITFQKDVSILEFLEAVKILMTFASKHQDEYVQLYDCHMSCKHFKTKPCPGDCMLSYKSLERCPFYQA